MTNYDNELIRLQQRVALKNQLQAKCEDLRRQRKELDSKLVQLRTACRMEQEDVDALEGKSFSNWLYQLFGKLDDKLTEERRQAAAARCKLDVAERELAAVDSELKEMQTQLYELRFCEWEYTNALQQKRDALKASGAPAADEILELEKKIAFQESQKKEIRQANAAGKEALYAADVILSKLKEAANWNRWDTWGGGGILTHMAKHDSLDEAQSYVLTLQSKLRNFRTELADVRIRSDLHVNVDNFTRFADYFFDNIFVDVMMGDRIREAQSSISSVRDQIEQAMTRLSSMETTADQKIAEYKASIEQRIIQA